MVKIMENPIKMDDLGVPLFLETPIFPQMVVSLMVMNPTVSESVKNHQKKQIKGLKLKKLYQKFSGRKSDDNQRVGM